MKYVPTVIDDNGKVERAFDIYSRLLQDRIVMIGSDVDENLANTVVAQLLYLESEAPDKDIYLYVNSPGGVVTDGLAIIDTMRYIKCDIHTICVGMCASMGAMILSSGTKGKRHALKHSRVMIHQVSGGCRGAVADMKTQLQEADELNEILKEMLMENCGKTRKQMEKAMDRDTWMNPVQAKEFGIIDDILER